MIRLRVGDYSIYSYWASKLNPVTPQQEVSVKYQLKFLSAQSVRKMHGIDKDALPQNTYWG